MLVGPPRASEVIGQARSLTKLVNALRFDRLPEFVIPVTVLWLRGALSNFANEGDFT
jgi:hypothetical protein